MTTLEVPLRELAERLSTYEKRTQALEAMLLHEARRTAPLHETPAPGGVETPRFPARLRKPAAAVEIIPSAVVASLDDAIWSLAPDGQQVYHLAGGVDRTFGRSAQEFLDRPELWFEIAVEHDRPALHDAFRQLPHTGSLHVEYAIRTASGSPRWVSCRGRLIRANDGTPLRIDGITTDITARMRTEHTGLTILEAIGARTGKAFLDAAVEHLAAAFETRDAIIAVPDPTDVNRACTAAAWIDGRLVESFAFSTHGRFVKDVLAGGSQCIPSAARDRYPSDGLLDRMRAEAAFAMPLVDDEARLLGFVALFDDRSVRGVRPDARRVLKSLAPRIAVELRANASGRVRELEAELAAAEDRFREVAQFDAVGRLLAGSVHDFNNLLTLITGHAELLREHLMPEPTLLESADLIASSGHAAARLARQLLAYSKPTSEDSSGVCDPNAALRESERLLARLVGERIELDLLLAPGVVPIRADRSAFDRVVLNLVINARDAIEDSGAIAVRTATARVPADRRGWPDRCPPGEYIALTVTDTGGGMSDAVKARLFTRFFTTKGANGTGLGLATVLDLVQAAGGHVELDSSTEWGTSVRVFWPVAIEVDEPASLRFEDALIGSSTPRVGQ